jgi:DNA-binding GntR family transcriptional regulator
MNRQIKLIWDFRGQAAARTAEHHEIHLKEFLEKENYILKITGFKITKVDQHISACLISKSQSKYLGVKSGSAGLNIVRHYYGKQNKLLLVTNSIYRADQYTYQVSLNYDQSLNSCQP